MSFLDEDTDVFTNHNVYILGAGFSKNAGMPLLKDFLNEMRSSVNWLKQNNRPEYKATRQVLLFRKGAASAGLRINMNVENIEDLFSLAAASGDETQIENISTAIAATLEYCRSHAEKPLEVHLTAPKERDAPTSWRNAGAAGDSTGYFVQLYDLYAGFLNGDLCDPQRYMQNTIISFNYDTVLEDALQRIGVPIDYGFNDDLVEYDQTWGGVQTNKDKVKVLKIHGSINWIQKEREIDKLTVYRTYDDGHHHGRVALIPPTWRKDFSQPLRDVWGQAIRALKNATRIIFIGFSFPETDAHIKYLLAAGMQENISLRNIFCANPMKAVEKNFFKVIKRDLKYQDIAKFCPIYTSRLINRFAQEYHAYPSMFGRPISNSLSITQFTPSGEEAQHPY